MIKKIKQSALLSLLMVILLFGLGSGCGRKAAPKPPSKDKPSAIKKIAPF